MTPLPNSLSISLWVVGCCWAVAAIAYVTDSETGLVVPLAIIGALTGLAEWLVRRQRH
jgi:predicted metal-binding membrane protein